jgi:hypothetical protein
MCRALAHDHGGRGSPAPAAPRADPARTVEPHLPGHARVRCGTRHSDHQPRVKATIENTTATRTPDNRLRRARVTRSGTCDSRCSGSVSTRLIHQSPDPRQKGECSHRGTRAVWGACAEADDVLPAFMGTPPLSPTPAPGAGVHPTEHTRVDRRIVRDCELPDDRCVELQTNLVPSSVEVPRFVTEPVEAHRYVWPTVRELTTSDIEQQRRLVGRSLLDLPMRRTAA